MKSSTIISLLKLFCALGVSAVVSCGYHLVGSNPPLPESARNIAILPIENQTLQVGLDTSLMINLRQRLRNNTAVYLTTEENADLVLKIQLLSINVQDTSVSPEGFTSEVKVTLVGQVSIEDRRIQKLLWEDRLNAESRIKYEKSGERSQLTVFSSSQGVDDLTKAFSDKVFERVFFNF